MRKNCINKLKDVGSLIFEKESISLSTFDKETIMCVLDLRIIEDDNCEERTLEKYKYFDKYFILKVEKNYYFIDTSFAGVDHLLKIDDYYVHQRKDKLTQIQNKIEQK